jgi:hypothetical protein
MTQTGLVVAVVIVGDQPFDVGVVRDLHLRFVRGAGHGGFVAVRSDAMIIIDDAGTSLFATRQVSAAFGYPPDQIVSNPVKSLVPERIRARHSSLGHIRRKRSGARTWRPLVHTLATTVRDLPSAPCVPNNAHMQRTGIYRRHYIYLKRVGGFSRVSRALRRV